jgi:DNA-binding NtrC family response regulator
MEDTDIVKVLAVDDDAQTLEYISAALDQPGVKITAITDARIAFDLFVRSRPHLVLLDLRMPGIGGMELLEQMVATDPTVEVILVTSDYSVDSAVEAVQKGASDYLTKPIDVKKLRRRIGELVAEVTKRQRLWHLDYQVAEVSQFEGMISRSPLMWEVFARIRRVAPHFSTALVTGPTGSGKELVAKALHSLNLRGSSKFVVCNCAAISEPLFESELFGHVRGAFTGATQDKVGLLEYANGGTLLLDEIGELIPAAQAKLLRVLQNHEFQRVGSPAVRKVDVRIIAATNRDLRTLAAENKFRADLYHRLSMVEINLPELAERKEDLPLLERHFIEQFSARHKKAIRGITRRARALLDRYQWPGNVRELENVLWNACMMSETDHIDTVDLPRHFRERLPVTHSSGKLSLNEMESRYVQEILEQVGGNKARAAEILRISRTTLYRLLSDAGNDETATAS